MSDRSTNAGTHDALAELREIERLRALEEERRRQREAEEQAAAQVAQAVEDEARRAALAAEERRQHEVEAMRRTLESLRRQIQDGAIDGVRVTPSVAPRRPWLPAAWIASVGAAAVLAVLVTRPSAGEVQIAPAASAPVPVEIERPTAAAAPVARVARPAPVVRPAPVAPARAPIAAGLGPTRRPPTTPPGRSPTAPSVKPAAAPATPGDEEDPLFGAGLDEKSPADRPAKGRRASP